MKPQTLLHQKFLQQLLDV